MRLHEDQLFVTSESRIRPGRAYYPSNSRQGDRVKGVGKNAARWNFENNCRRNSMGKTAAMFPRITLNHFMCRVGTNYQMELCQGIGILSSWFLSKLFF
ncbi:hypothetical protein CEXT_539961 [Caerostris extrusa]|uniref:Uncharacterized protein n=1 Tax=Caerostris extrusa TaxID=172846 RepID=A0AAV4QFQ5_CAEEX|nr:hypothetical protein CEXT_539961 [Caerostris extrusa]